MATGAQTVLGAALESLRVLEPLSQGRLAVCGLGWPAGVQEEARILALDEALDRGDLRIEESPENSVSTLQLEHIGDRPVLLLEGEELVGARQNRSLNISVLVLPGAAVALPVSCVEMGRWAYHGEQVFRSTGTAAFASLRASIATRVYDSSYMGIGIRANQGDVWERVGRRNAALQVASETSAMHDMYTAYDDALEDLTSMLVPPDDWTGAVFFLDGEAVGAEVLATPELLRKVWRKLVRSYAADALVPPTARSASKPDPSGLVHTADNLLGSVGKFEWAEEPAVGAGSHMHLRGAGFTGAALLHGGMLAHLVLFSDSFARR